MATDETTRAERSGRNIIVCCDGTGNRFIDDPEAKGSNSNVVKLYTTLAINKDQVAYYRPGVGTAGDPRAKGWLARKWSVLKGLAFAEGFKDNVLDAYRYLMETYRDGDKVFLIGFSRGAYTARALAGLLDGYGLLCKGNEGHILYAWNEYVKQHQNRAQQVVKPNHAFKQTFSHPGFSVHFLGIWDTVSSVGWISTPLRLWNVARASGVETGRHAISIDERRCFYRDNLWVDAKLDIKGQQEVGARARTALEDRQDLLQVWFPGVHSDIGGSYPQNESVLANHALRWLIEETRKAGALIKPEMTKVVLGEPAVGENEVERERICDLEGLYKAPEKLMVHKSLRGAWWMLEMLPHRYYDKDEGEEVWRTPLGMRRRIPSGAYVHRTAKELMTSDTFLYEPRNIVDGERSLQEAHVTGQAEGELLQYVPAYDPQPLWNQPAVRWAVMIGVSAVDLAVVGLMFKGAWSLGRKVGRLLD